MIIACLGWGSLIWDPRELPIHRQWFDDGPFIKIEFARKSDDGRSTLVIVNDDASTPVRTLWAAMDATDIDSAKEALRRREGMPRQAGKEPIGQWIKTQQSPPADIPMLSYWAKARGVDAVIWTALPPKFNDKGKPTIIQVLKYLRGLEGAERDHAERYIRLAPRQIDTAYRRKIEADLGWTSLDNWPR